MIIDTTIISPETIPNNDIIGKAATKLLMYHWILDSTFRLVKLLGSYHI